jgi:hypothetical protein
VNKENVNELYRKILSYDTKKAKELFKSSMVLTLILGINTAKTKKYMIQTKQCAV